MIPDIEDEALIKLMYIEGNDVDLQSAQELYQYLIGNSNLVRGCIEMGYEPMGNSDIMFYEEEE